MTSLVFRRAFGLSFLLPLVSACSSSPSGNVAADAGGSAPHSDAGKHDASSPPKAGDDASDDTTGVEAPDAAGGDASTAGGDGAPAPEAGSDSDGEAPDAAAPDAAPACVKGQVTPNQVVMLGDSYLDPTWANTSLDLFATAQDAGALPAKTTWRHYYVGGASMAWGNPDTQFFIPYQYDPMAKNDTAVPKPKDIKVVIMDGGGNDVLIGNNSCLTTAPPDNASCTKTVQDAIDKATSEMKLLAGDGIETVLYFFYPHLDPAGGGILTVPSPGVNKTLDYAYPLAEQLCCTASFTATIDHPYCVGQPVAGSAMRCVFVDTRPAFEGHASDYIKDDHVHPNPAGAQVLSDTLWKTMQETCIAQ